MPKNHRAALAAARGLCVETLKNDLLKQNVPVVRKVAPPTEIKYELAKKCWLEYREFLGEENESAESTLETGATQPTVQTLKSFILWWVQGTSGRISEYPTLRTCLLNWRNFRRMFHRCTGEKIHKDVAEDVRAYISEPLRQELGIKHEIRPQGYTDEVDLEVLLTYLWCRDYHEYKHDRYRVQLAFLILLFFYTGARCGSFTRKSEYQDLDFTYKNIEVVISSSNNALTVYLKVNQDNMKGKKGTPEFVDVILRERKNMSECPVIAFLALAFADQAFQEISTPEQFFSLRLPKGQDQFSVPWKPEMMDIPIFKQWAASNHMTKANALSRGHFESSLAELSIRIGYEISVKPHYIRRGVANRVDKHATVAEKCHLLGHHNPSVYRKNYISSISNIDVQGAILDNETNDDHIQPFRRIVRHDDSPKRLPLETEMTLLDSSAIKGLKKRISDNPHDETATRILKKEYAALKRTILKDALEKERKERFQKWNIREISRQLNSNGNADCEDTALGRVSDDSVKISMIQRLCPDRGLIADACILGKIDLWTDQSILHSLIRLCSEDSRVQYYPGEYSVQGKCPKCNMDMESIDEAKALLRALKEHTSELLISSHEVLEHSAIRSTVYRPRLCPNYEDQITDVSPIADIDQTADVTPTSETSSLSPTSDSGLPTALSDCPISPSPNLGTLDASITSSSGGGMKRKASNSDTTRHSKQRKRQLDMICESKILPTGQLPDGREYICSAFILPGYGTDLFMIAMDLRRLLGYTHSRCLFGNPYDPRPTLVPEAAVSYLKDQSLLPQAYSRRNLSLVKAFDMFRKFGHRVILNGAPHLPTINGDLVDAAIDSSRSSPVPRTACPTISNLSEPVTPHPSIEESTLPKITARKTKKPKPKPKPKSQARSPSEEMENRNRVIRLHAGYSKDGVVAGANSRYL